MQEYEIAALTVGLGYLVSVVRTWIRVRGHTSMAHTRSHHRGEMIRGLPVGSRFTDEHDKITVEVGKPQTAEQQGDASVTVDR
ncbi:hypothetical protein OG818_40125 [Streptomyces virginiae]|uniref:hypothetical protein n=1 Tax=Streptomyces TaxID=1883 RepID=UPI002258C3F8|nr:hypothetical protein [Streptomyces virginiae]MCX4721908.1 hypothetical protein [Streptomyces virginiae]WTB27879.1 hypothetical protein OG253_41005 [Streptomyces virginiae]